MGLWLVDADVLARSRFALSPLIETVAALGVLADRRPDPWQRAWLAESGPAYRSWISGRPVARAWVAAVLGTRWLPDFVGMPPQPGDVTFEQELARVRATPPEVAKADTLMSCPAGLPPALDVPDLAERVADLLDWVWTHTVAPDWPRRSRIYQADVVSRTHRLSRDGWAAAIEGLSPQLRWLGEGRLQINASDRPPRDLTGAELLFIPSSARRGWVGWELPHRFAVVYQASGLLLPTGPPGAPAALARLLGPTRAALLARLDAPTSTTQLVALTGLGLGTVGDHLKVLLDARLVERRRAGASVLYYRTAVGEQLLAAQGVGPVPGQMLTG